MSFLDRPGKMVIESRNSIGNLIDAAKSNIAKTLMAGAVLTASVAAGITALNNTPNAIEDMAAFTPQKLSQFIEVNVNSAIPDSLKSSLEKIKVQGDPSLFANRPTHSMSKASKTCTVNLDGLDRLAFHEGSNAEMQKHMRNFMSISEAANCITSIIDQKNSPIDRVLSSQKNDGTLSQDDFNDRNKFMTQHAKYLASDIFAFSTLIKTMVLDVQTQEERKAGLDALINVAFQHNFHKPNQFGPNLDPRDTQEAMFRAINALIDLTSNKHGIEKLKFILSDNERSYDFSNKAAAGYVVENYQNLNDKYTKNEIVRSEANIEYLTEMNDLLMSDTNKEYKASVDLSGEISKELQKINYFASQLYNPQSFDFDKVISNSETTKSLDNSLTSWNIIGRSNFWATYGNDFIKNDEAKNHLPSPSRFSI